MSASAAIAERLRLAVAIDRLAAPGSRSHRATATARDGAAPFIGHGTGRSAEEASARAVMEYVERYAQFGPAPLPRVTTAPFTAMTDAIPPPELGLYAPAQYRAPGLECAPFSADDPLEWVEGRALATGAPRRLPVEFILPRAPLARLPLVHETSSGTAAHPCPDAAALAALCEVVERDAFMLFWYRRPPTATLRLRALPPSPDAEDLLALQAIGFVVTLCCLDGGLDIPCFLALALRGPTFAYGLGCHPNAATALEHAARELLVGVDHALRATPTTLLHRALPEVRTGADHHSLYHHGPLHEALRAALAQTLLPPAAQHPWLHADAPLSPRAALDHALSRLAMRGLCAIACDLTPAALAGLPVHVARVLVPGLAPIHFGMDRIRLGCRRLVGRGAPGRLSTLLPHFMH